MNAPESLKYNEYFYDCHIMNKYSYDLCKKHLDDLIIVAVLFKNIYLAVIFI